MRTNRSEKKIGTAAVQANALICAALICSAVCALLFTLLFLTSFGEKVRYFQDGVLLGISKYFLIGSLIAMIVFPCFIPKADKTASNSPLGSRTAIIPAASMAGTCVFMLVNLFTKDFSGRAAREVTSTKVLLILTAVLSALSAIYYCLCYIGKASADVTSAFGFAAILQPVGIIGLTYFDQYMELNAPEKIGIQFGYALLMIFTTCEIRYIIGKPMPRMALSIGCISVVISCATFIPNVIAHFGGVLYTVSGALIDSNDYLWFSLAGILNTVYQVARLISNKKVFAPQSVTEETAGLTVNEEATDTNNDPESIVEENQTGTQPKDRE